MRFVNRLQVSLHAGEGGGELRQFRCAIYGYYSTKWFPCAMLVSPLRYLFEDIDTFSVGPFSQNQMFYLWLWFGSTKI